MTKEDLVQAHISFMLIQMMCMTPFQLGGNQSILLLHFVIKYHDVLYQKSQTSFLEPKDR